MPRYIARVLPLLISLFTMVQGHAQEPTRKFQLGVTLTTEYVHIRDGKWGGFNLPFASTGGSVGAGFRSNYLLSKHFSLQAGLGWQLRLLNLDFQQVYDEIDHLTGNSGPLDGEVVDVKGKMTLSTVDFSFLFRHHFSNTTRGIYVGLGPQFILAVHHRSTGTTTWQGQNVDEDRNKRAFLFPPFPAIKFGVGYRFIFGNHTSLELEPNFTYMPTLPYLKKESLRAFMLGLQTALLF